MDDEDTRTDELKAVWSAALVKTLGDDALISYGTEVKALADGQVSGYLVRFSGEDQPDLEGEFFTKQTDFDIRPGERTPIYYHHGQDPMLGKRIIGEGSMLLDDVGVWVEGQLKLRDNWERAVREMGLRGKLNWSSGTAPHLVEKETKDKAVWIKRWPLRLDASMTPTPAEPAIVADMKSYRAMEWPSLKAYLPEELVIGTGSADAGQDTKEPTKEAAKDVAKTRRLIMRVMQSGGKFHVMNTDEDGNVTGLPIETRDTQEEAQAYIDEANKPPEMKMWERAMQENRDAIQKIVAAVQRPAVAPTGSYLTKGWAEPRKAATQNEWLDWTIAFLANDTAALKRMGSEWTKFKEPALKVYSDGQKVQGDQTGPAGGYTVPPQFGPLLMPYRPETEIVWPRCIKRTVTGRTMTLPTVSLSSAAAGQSQYFGGWWAAWTETGTQKHETEIEFGEQEWVVHELSAYTEVKDALLEDSAIAFAEFLQQNGRDCILYMVDEACLDGTGAGMPQGVINAPGTIARTRQTAGHITYEDAKGMFMHLVGSSRGQAIWVINQFCMAEIMDWEDTEGHLIWQPNAREGVPQQIFNRPVFWTEKVPDLGARGDIGLYDFGHYIAAMKPGDVALGRSEHFRFDQNRTAFRWVIRLDGQEDLPAPINTKSGNNTVSPFVVLDRAAETT